MSRKYRKVNIDTNKLFKNKNGFVDWIGSVGITMDYSIENTEYKGSIKLVDVVPPNKIVVQIDNEIPIIVTRDSFIRTGLVSYMGIKTRVFKYDVGDVINTNKSSIIILNKKLIDNNTGYRVRCLKDNYEFDITSSNLNEALKMGHTRCPVCCNHLVIDGINSLYDENPSLAEWFIDKDVPHKISRYSNKEQDLKCPICGYLLRVAPSYVKTTPCCPRCGDGISYPEKMFANLLCQLKVKYISQLNKKHFDWCDMYRYDFYFENNNQCYIFELDGGLGHGKIELNMVDSLKRDKIKDSLAKENGMTLIRIDVDYDDIENRFDYIKHNICNSILSELFDLNSVDWNSIEMLSNKSYLQICCNEYNMGNTYIRNIAEKCGISKDSVRRYLKIGSKIGLCSYEPSDGWKDYMEKYHEPSTQKYAKVVYNNKTIVCKGITKLSKQIKDVFDISITTEQIFRHLKNPSIKSRKKLFISYATENEYLDYFQCLQ